MKQFTHVFITLALIFTLASMGYAADLADLRVGLRTEFGEGYEALRGEALNLVDEEFESLLEPWEAMRDDSIEQLLADALRLRRAEDQSALKFDMFLEYEIANPNKSNHSGRPRYFWGADKQKSALGETNYPLIFEAVVKLDMPPICRFKLLGGLSNRALIY